MKNCFFILMAICFTGMIVYGDYDYNGIHAKAGKSFFPFLKLGYEARALAMGGASVGMPNDLYGALSNPAALGFGNTMQALISYKPVMLDVRGGALGFAWPREAKGMWAVNIMYVSYGVFTDNLFDENGSTIDGTINPYSIAASVTWSKKIFESLSYGATVKGIYDRLSEGIGIDIPRASADGFAVDMGLQYRTKSSRLIYGLLVQNVGFIRSSYSEDIEKTTLPLSLIVGMSYVFKNFPSVRTAFDLEKSIDDYLQYKLGLELNIYKQMFFIRGGYVFSQSDLEEFFAMIKNGKFDQSYQKTNWSLFSAGAGVKADIKEVDVNLDLALNFRVDRLAPSFALTLLLGF